MDGEYDVLVIGTAALDIKVHTRALAIEPELSNPAIIELGFGGVARNIAENLVRLGGDVSLISAVGVDEAGTQIVQQLRDVGIHTDAMIVTADHNTGAFVGIYQLDKRLRVAFDDMQVIRLITPGYLNQHRSLFHDADVICIDANLSARALETVFRLARAYDVPVCADATTPLLAQRLHPFLPELAALAANRAEAEALLGTHFRDEDEVLQGARRLAQLGVDLAIITQGAEGLSYATSDESGRLPAFNVEVVDPVGAGDALTAAVAYGLAEGLAPTEVVRLGLAAAAQTIVCQETVCPYISLEVLYERLVV
ncbi:MAG: bifunctional hydroxymethylpyrimidine kinase/phosphomethylpyrimidine kinase [Anaerolineae bacterium]|nr:bifunctional hydroxymethylpyrimidine kinase/phosphomethylpyrimidine kinase [Anaerolineae bacterium]